MTAIAIAIVQQEPVCLHEWLSIHGALWKGLVKLLGHWFGSAFCTAGTQWRWAATFTNG